MSTVTTALESQSKPSGITWVPHDYQSRAVKMMLEQGAVGLLLDPGLGKTSITLAAFKILKDHGYAHRMLLIAPLRPAYSTWPAEVHKWAQFNDLTYAVVHGANKEWKLGLDVDIHIINPEGLLWLANRKSLPEWDTLCIDESTKFKETNTRRYKVLKSILSRFRRRWILTGTPMPNSLMDLFGQIYILDLGRALGKYVTHFRAEFFTRGYNLYEWKPNPGAFDKVIERISPLCLRLSAEEYLEMPDLIEVDIPVVLPEEAMEHYTNVEDEFITELEGETIVAGNAAAAGVKCRQIANGAVYKDAERNWVSIHDEKLEALKDLLEELNGHPVLVLYEFDHDRQRILESIPNVVDFKSGNIQETVRRFNSGDISVLVGHPASMGHGLNLQDACHHVIWFGITWNLEHYDQAVARVYRQGQSSKKVFVYHIIAKDTLDERVAKVLEAKDRSQQDLLKALASARRDAL